MNRESSCVSNIKTCTSVAPDTSDRQLGEQLAVVITMGNLQSTVCPSKVMQMSLTEIFVSEVGTDWKSGTKYFHWAQQFGITYNILKEYKTILQSTFIYTTHNFDHDNTWWNLQLFTVTAWDIAARKHSTGTFIITEFAFTWHTILEENFLILETITVLTR
jgi:hypothetical protein